MLAKPTKDRASAPKAEVVVMPMLCNRYLDMLHTSPNHCGKMRCSKDN